MRSALARQNRRPWEDWASTRAVGASPSVRQAVLEAPAHVQATVEAYSTSFGATVTTSHIPQLQHAGHQIVAGSSWLLMTLDANDAPVLARLPPLNGIFTVDGMHFFLAVIHSGVSLSDPNPTRTATIPRGSEITTDIVSLDEILELTVLHPSKCEKTADGEVWTLVEV